LQATSRSRAESMTASERLKIDAASLRRAEADLARPCYGSTYATWTELPMTWWTSMRIGWDL
jgi:hypothetical protein